MFPNKYAQVGTVVPCLLQMIASWQRGEEEILERTADEIDEFMFEEQLARGEYDEEVPEYDFSNPDPYAKVEPCPMMNWVSRRMANAQRHL